MRIFLLLILALGVLPAQAKNPVPDRQLQTLFKKEPALNQIYIGCKNKHQSNSSRLTDLEDCIWKKVKPNRELRKKLIQHLSGGEKSLTPSEIENLATKSSASLSQNDKVLSVVRDVFAQKLDKSFHQTDKKGSIKIANQGTFFRLGKTQLSKGILMAITGYCLDLDPSDHIIYPDKTRLQTNRKKNLLSLKKAAQAEQNFARCLKIHLPQNCYCLDNSNPPTKVCGSFRDPGASDKAVQHTKYRSCQVLDYIKAAKESVSQINLIQKTLEQAQMPGVDWSNTDIGQKIDLYSYGNKKGEENVDELTGITSGEIKRGKGRYSQGRTMKDLSKEEEKRWKKCQATKSKKDCASFFVMGKKKENMEISGLSYFLKRKLLTNYLQEQLKDKKVLKRYLKNKGMSEKQIALEMRDQRKIIDEIKNKQEQRTKALLNGMADKLDKITAQDQRSLPAKIQQMNQDRRKAKDSYYQEYVHYNNIISGYLSKHNQTTGKKSRNTQALKRELGDHAFDKGSGRPAASYGKRQVGQLKKAIEQTPHLKGNQNDRNDPSSDITFKEGVLNSILEGRDNQSQTSKKEKNPPTVGP